MDTTNLKAEASRYTTFRPIRCPRCRGKNVRITGTHLTLADGELKRYCLCRSPDCLWRFAAFEECEEF